MAPDDAPAILRRSPAEERFERIRRGIGAALAPTVFLYLLAFPPAPSLSIAGQRCAALAAAVVVLWMTEAIPIAVTSLAIPIAATLLSICDAKVAFAPFASPLIFLFMGGFMLAQGLKTQGLDRRVTLWLLSRNAVGGSPWRTLVALAVLSFSLSMWMSNAATVALLLPIVLGVTQSQTKDANRNVSDRDPPSLEVPPSDPQDTSAPRFAELTLLAVAYAASLGGMATPVGTAPNLIALDQLQARTGESFDFVEWMAVALPTAAAILAIVLLMMRWSGAVPRVGSRDAVRAVAEQHRALGLMRPGERRVALVFAGAAVCWLAPTLLKLTLGKGHPAVTWTSSTLDEGVVALSAALLLCVLPSGARVRLPDAEGDPRSAPLLPWSTATEIDWGTLFLLGGSFTLSQLCFATGVADALTAALLPANAGATILLVAGTVLVLYLTEVVSNTAITGMMVPIVLSMALQAGLPPAPIVMCVTLAASCAFMLPVGTPPNAMVYGTGQVRIATMVRYGFWLDLGALVVLLGLGLTWLAIR